MASLKLASSVAWSAKSEYRATFGPSGLLDLPQSTVASALVAGGCTGLHIPVS
jgi:hypothetical protein